MAEQKMNFYRSFWDMANVLSATGRRRFITATVDYFFTGAEPDGLTAKEAALFSGIRGRVDASRSGAEFARRRYEGAKAAPSVGPSDPRQATGQGGTQAGTQRGGQAGTHAGTHATEGEGDIEIKRERGRARAGVRTNVGPPLAEAVTPPCRPDPDEVAAWFEANGRGMGRTALLAEAAKFWDHFEAQGWVTGAGVPISRWQAKASAWLRRCEEGRTRGRGAGAAASPACDFSAYSAVGEVVANG
nr:MAG TPA: hypothetical protein [Caudoviricetes sp.]